MKRVILFLATNFAILIVLGVALSILMPVLGIDSQSNGGLLLMCAVFGMGGSFISLAMSKWIAKRSVGAVVIEQPANQQETWLLDTVKRQANQASIGMPEVAVWDSPEINAFATGMNKNNALVAVSTGLLRTMTKDEAEAVLAHEISHVANGDMVTLALIQGVVNTFVYFFARIAASALSRGSNNRFMYFMTVMFFQFVFGILASTIVMWFSRRREYRADEGGANLAGDKKMIAALQRLKGDSQESHLDGQLVAFGISGKKAMAALFLSHPPLEKRIAALQARAIRS
ncbi:MAG: protease HtpX [Halioglobus sp.]|jgi:heat shock protein HtpX|uniref:protease HtpX n=1 Tax=Halioglobus sp. Uisw_031 TaxID=3230977 RepID=UPI0030A5B5E0|tara:strand:- start:165 stop:1025 length:861 start_codon:yes stop_codon:yes gene_type:complete